MRADILTDIADGAALAALLITLGLWAILGHAVLGPDAAVPPVPYGIVRAEDNPGPRGPIPTPEETKP